MTDLIKKDPKIEELFNVGAHFGFSKSRRHPSANNLIFGSKNRVDVFDLEKTSEYLEKALNFIEELAKTKSTILFVGGKNEAQNATREFASMISMPFVAGRWIGGTLTNFSEIRKRVDTMISLSTQKEKGELSKYTKKERLLIDRDITKLEKMFGGIKDMTQTPKAVFIVDPRFEKTALREAKILGLPIIAICGSDNDISLIDYAIPANDSNIKTISYLLNKVTSHYQKFVTV